MLRIVIAGSRNFNNFELLEKNLIMVLFDLNKKYPQLNVLTIDKQKHSYRINRENIEIISGKAKGADTLGEKFAEKYSLALKEFPAKWDDLSATPCKVVDSIHGEYNALAGHNRNRKMAEYASSDDSFGVLTLFWDGQSKGSKNMKAQAVIYSLELYEFTVNKQK